MVIVGHHSVRETRDRSVGDEFEVEDITVPDVCVPS
jgi:hypothetical protein